MKVQIFTLKGVDVEILYRNNSIAYTFVFNGKPYGTSLKLNTRLKNEQAKLENVVAVTYQLFTSALETLEALQNEHI